MARPLAGSVAPAAPYLTPAFWRDISGHDKPSPRDRFLFLTIHEFGQKGPGSFSHIKVAKDLGYTSAMINHYFGSRNGLIAEAASTVYAQYVEAMRQGVADAPANPDDRFRAWLKTQIEFANDRPGWALVHNYPNLALENPLDFETKFRDEMTQGFEINLGRLAQLILDVWSGRVSAVEITRDSFDKTVYLSNRWLTDLTASVAMSTLGAAVWSAGSHAPSSATAEAMALREHVITGHIENVLTFVKSQRPRV